MSLSIFKYIGLGTALNSSREKTEMFTSRQYLLLKYEMHDLLYTCHLILTLLLPKDYPSIALSFYHSYSDTTKEIRKKLIRM